MSSSAVATEPFNAVDADVNLRTSDQVLFRVHKRILSLSSSFFRTTFALPQSAESETDVPTVDVLDSAAVLDGLLRLIYPVPHTPIQTLDEVVPILQAAEKYDVPAALQILRQVLLTPAFLDQTPLRVFAIAARYDFEEEAKLASRYTLHLSVLDAPPCDELKLITAHTYHQLLTLHRQRRNAAIKLLENSTWPQCSPCNYWWLSFRRKAIAEISDRPVTDTIFSTSYLFDSSNIVLDGYRMGSCNRICGFPSLLISLKHQIDSLPCTI